VPDVSDRQIARVFREEYGRAVAVLVRSLGSLDAAEEAVQDAFAEAARRWPAAGLPPSPAGWIITTARNRAIDRHRRSPSARTGTPRPRCCTCRTSRPRRAPCVTTGSG
jgi:RNA polymerase sigma-70 factor (ECF subfamily)